MNFFRFYFLRNLLIIALLPICIYSAGISSNTLEKRSKLCRNYPDAMPPFRFHRETSKCYQVGEQKPCPSLMKFTLEDDDFGFCDCDLSQRCGRPLVYWPARKRCYHVYDQGPCRDGKWLVFGFDLQPVCKKNICLQKEDEVPSHGPRYWFSYNNTCYRTFTRGYCPEPEDILYNANQHFRPSCQKSSECDKDTIQVARCLPGQRADVLGYCKRKFVPFRNITRPLRIPATEKPDNVYCLFCEDKKPQNYKV